MLKTIGADVLETRAVRPAAQTAFTADGRLRDRELALALREIVCELLQQTAARAA